MQRLSKGALPPATGVFTECKICHGVKDDCEFKWQGGKRQGLVCRMCDRLRKASAYAANPEPAKRKSREWLAENPERASDSAKRYRVENAVTIQTRRVSYHIENAERINGKSRLWYAANRERQSKYARDYIARNPESVKAAKALYYQRTKLQHKERMRKWRALNPRKISAYVRAYMLRRELRTPAWSEAVAIREFYYLCPPGHEVDHIIPLKGRLVSGLHVLANLQHLTRSANASKSNTFDPMRFENA